MAPSLPSGSPWSAGNQQHAAVGAGVGAGSGANAGAEYDGRSGRGHVDALGHVASRTFTRGNPQPTHLQNTGTGTGRRHASSIDVEPPPPQQQPRWKYAAQQSRQLIAKVAIPGHPGAAMRGPPVQVQVQVPHTINSISHQPIAPAPKWTPYEATISPSLPSSSSSHSSFFDT
mmetsp:Transcript_12719/g.21137  ORF Transcript_12719/g.21137 Transcript_12719/m.21137 type:complete len:173 (+) Transcript_12719:525-1043(+)|eukprot:CAMPEP_0174962686 /NCGR_PEP_ID=MMETSP0004_2-20121128/4917_1 /TAXON_ID=420556 /ORGANISM="Ochromonas sp., Strain CCMP1393" /LENGTH=172 /DNA_ID=CAMNT_0016211237 /DNA_START=462 /DNA_END=980 /DNA_ORIENTATION=+